MVIEIIKKMLQGKVLTFMQLFLHTIRFSENFID